MNKNFDVLNTYFTRSPLLNINFFSQQLKNVKNLKEMVILSNDDKINEGILIANKEFHSILKEDMGSKSLKKRRNIESTLFNYLNRMVFRANPFGLFSSVDISMFSDDNFTLHNKNIKSFLTIDVNWSIELQKLIENNNSYLMDMKLKASRRILSEGDRIFIYDNHNEINKMKKYNDLYSVKNTAMIKLIISESDEYVSTKVIISKIKEKYPDVSTPEILNFIKKLIKYEIIFTNLKPSIPIRGHFEIILSFLERNKEINPDFLHKVSSLDILLKRYNNLDVGNPDGVKMIGEINDKAKEIHEYKNPIHVDSTHSGGGKLTTEDRKAVTEAINLFTNFCVPQTVFPENEIILNFFQKNYNEHEEIEIKKLVHSEEFRNFYNENLYKLQAESIRKVKNEANYLLLKEWILQTIVNQDEELIITEDHIAELEKNIDEEKMTKLHGLEVPMNIHKNKDGTTIVINTNEINSDIGMYLGRFGYLFAHKKKELEEVYNSQLSKYSSEYMIPEISALSKRKGANNLGTSISIREANIIINTQGNNNTNSIEIDDIVIGMHKNQIYVKSISNNKFIRPKQSNMLATTNVFSEEYNNLMKLGTYGELTMEPLMNHLFRELNYMPRIRYKDVILSKRKWKFRTSTILNNYDNNLVNLKKSLLSLLKINSKTEMIGLNYRNNNIYFSLKNDYHIDLMKNILKKEKEITIVEADPNFFANKSNNDYNEQFVFFAKNKSFKKINPPISVTEKINSKKKRYYPWDNWLFFSLYFREERQDEFLTNYLKPFIGRLKADNVEFSWFYIRYKDPSSHIRLRFYSQKKEVKIQLYNILSDFYKQVHENIPLERILLDSYSPEYLRYGGEEMMPHIERYFNQESCYCLELIESIKDKDMNTKMDVIILYLYDLMDSLGFSDKQKVDFIKYNKQSNFKKIPKEVRLKQTERKILIADHLKNRNSTSSINKPRTYFNELNYYFNTLDMVTSREAIVSSLIHMFINRVKNINLTNEDEIMLALKLAISDYYYSNNH